MKPTNPQLQTDSDTSSIPKQRNHYYIKYPHGLGVMGVSWDYTIYVAGTPASIAWAEDQVESACEIPDSDRVFRRISRKEAVDKARSTPYDSGYFHRTPFWRENFGSRLNLKTRLEASARCLEETVKFQRRFDKTQASGIGEISHG